MKIGMSNVLDVSSASRDAAASCAPPAAAVVALPVAEKTRVQTWLTFDTPCVASQEVTNHNTTPFTTPQHLTLSVQILLGTLDSPFRF